MKQRMVSTTQSFLVQGTISFLNMVTHKEDPLLPHSSSAHLMLELLKRTQICKKKPYFRTFNGWPHWISSNSMEHCIIASLLLHTKFKVSYFPSQLFLLIPECFLKKFLTMFWAILVVSCFCQLHSENRYKINKHQRGIRGAICPSLRGGIYWLHLFLLWRMHLPPPFRKYLWPVP